MSLSANPVRLSVRSRSAGHLAELAERRHPAEFLDLGKLLQEPRVDPRQLVERLDRPAAAQRAEERPHPPIVGHDQPFTQRGFVLVRVRRVVGARRKQAAELAELERSHRLEERFLERPADRHRLPHRLHLRRQRAIRLRELLEVPPRELDDDVVDGRLEGRGRQARDVVRDLVEVIAERELGGDLRDREAGGLRRERRRPRHARVHLDGDDAAVLGVDGELDVRPAGLDADAADDAPRHVAHALVFLVGQRQRRRHRDAVAGVDAHRIDVLDRADDDEVVGDVAHHLELEFLPADDRLLDEDLVHRAEVEPAARQLAELLDVVGDAAADAAHRERRPDDRREADLVDQRQRLFQRLRDAALRHLDADLRHRVAEEQAVFGHLDRLDRGADQLDAVFLEHAALGERHRQVERGLAADGRQHRVGTLLLDDRLDHLGRERLDVGAVGHLGVGHDRRRVAVHQHDLEPLGAQRLARLRARVVELARLADDDRARADDEHPLQISPLGHLDSNHEGTKTRRTRKWSCRRDRRALKGVTSSPSTRGTAGTDSRHRADPGRPPDDTAPRRSASTCGGSLRRCRRRG